MNDEWDKLARRARRVCKPDPEMPFGFEAAVFRRLQNTPREMADAWMPLLRPALGLAFATAVRLTAPFAGAADFFTGVAAGFFAAGAGFDLAAATFGVIAGAGGVAGAAAGATAPFGAGAGAGAGFSTSFGAGRAV